MFMRTSYEQEYSTQYRNTQVQGNQSDFMYICNSPTRLQLCNYILMQLVLHVKNRTTSSTDTAVKKLYPKKTPCS